jgi:NCAIR mutase (PurE)-related protein
LTAGTSDYLVAAEAEVLLRLSSPHSEVLKIQDVGVAGIHRLLDQVPAFSDADVIIVVAGMDGALPSVVGGLVKCPVVAVPTSVGYGAAFAGVAPLLTMLNSCSPGVSVVNIDNGFGAAVVAHKILRGLEAARRQK